MAIIPSFSLSNQSVFFQDYFLWNSSGTTYTDSNSNPVLTGQRVKGFIEGGILTYKTEDGADVVVSPDDLISYDKERLAFSFSINLNENTAVSIDTAINEGIKNIDLSALTAGSNVLTDHADYDFSYALVDLLGSEDLRKNSNFGEDLGYAGNGATNLDSTTIADSRYREGYLGWYRLDGVDPDITDESKPKKIIGSRGVAVIEGVEQIKNFRMIPNTDGFDAQGVPHVMTVHLYIGRTKNS